MKHGGGAGGGSISSGKSCASCMPERSSLWSQTGCGQYRDGSKQSRGPMGDIAAALRMHETFASCGAQSFVITKTELEWPGHKKVKWGKTYSTEELREKLPAMVRAAATRRPVMLPDGRRMLAGENLIMRPTGAHTAFVQLDDLQPEQLERLR